ncbi:glycosyltransferase family 4 protein [Fictibacillus iocasae]|uniref:Glycosyltransferase family 4 protein n=1 Tax=Fictibacillus iocasae TaxID=2715437 RepID=A0ABW2NT65_9BACL
MKIIFLNQHFPPEVGAPQIRVYEVSKELMSRGHQVEVLTAFPHHPMGVIPEGYRGRFYMKEEYDGISVHRSWIYPSPKGSFWKRLMSYFSFTFSSFYSLAVSKKADVIICTSPPLFLGITGYVGSLFKRAKFVFNVADIWPESAVKLGLVKNKQFIALAEWLEMFLYKRSWKMAGATEGISAYMGEKSGRPHDSFMLPNGVNTDTFAPLEPDQELMDELNLHGKKVFAYTGTMGYAQGLDSILLVAEKVRDELPNVHFLFIGDGQEKEMLLSMKEEKKLHNVTFKDSVPVAMMPKVFSISDYSIVPLKNLEIFKGARPSKIFPALSTGTPVLYCGEGEAAELISSNACGAVAEPENVEAIAQQVRYLAELSEAEYRTLSENGRDFVIREYSWKRIVDDLLENIKDASSEREREAGSRG